MTDRQQYDEAAHSLSVYGYEVILDPPGYIVRHHKDRDDVSRARHLADLVELAELMEWAARRRELVSGCTTCRPSELQ
jgi:hypothetical protein